VYAGPPGSDAAWLRFERLTTWQRGIPARTAFAKIAGASGRGLTTRNGPMSCAAGHTAVPPGTDGEPWLPLGSDVQQRNVADERADPLSTYNLHRRLIMLRRGRPALAIGTYKPLFASGDLLLFLRELDSECIFVALNLGVEPAEITLPIETPAGRVLLSTFGDREGEAMTSGIALRPDEGLIVELSASSPETRPTKS
jgi:hypothetical protein